jgi:hypothetical protein
MVRLLLNNSACMHKLKTTYKVYPYNNQKQYEVQKALSLYSGIMSELQKSQHYSILFNGTGPYELLLY